MKSKMKPLGYSQSELEALQRYSRNRTAYDNLVKKTYHATAMISYLVLHDKFGFGQKRIIRLEQSIDKYLSAYADGALTVDALASVLRKSGLDVKEVPNGIPSREKYLAFIGKIPTKDVLTQNKVITASIYNYLALCCTALKTVFKMSNKAVTEYMQWVAYYVNTLSDYPRYEVSVADIESVLAEECRYIAQKKEGVA